MKVEVDPSASLVERIAGGDAEAFAALYDQHAPVLLACAVRILGGKADAEVLVDRLFADTWSSIRGITSRGGTSIATDLCLELRRRALALRGDRTDAAHVETSQGSRTAKLAPAVEVTASRDQQASDSARAARRERASRAVSSLPLRTRTVLELGWFEGLSAEQIAARLSSTVESVRAEMRAGLEAIATRSRGDAP